MKIRELFQSGRRLFSFEFFPPKTDAGATTLAKTIGELSDLQPAFVSVTYGAGGTTRDRTVELVTRIQKGDGLTAMAHLTCVGANRDEIAAVIDRLVDGGIENIIALRGDPPPGQPFTVTPDGFAHASDLVAFIRRRYGDRLCLAAACYPENHLECRDPVLDMRNLVTKVNAGADFIVTQLFFDNRFYFDFVGRQHPPGAVRGAGPAPRRSGGRPATGRGPGHCSVRGPARGRSARHPLLYAEPIARHAHDPDRVEGHPAHLSPAAYAPTSGSTSPALASTPVT
jgi:hypothetical protein